MCVGVCYETVVEKQDVEGQAGLNWMRIWCSGGCL